MLNLQSSQLTTFYECPRKWYYNYHLWRGIKPNDAMKRGSCFHQMAEFYFKDKIELTMMREAISDYSEECGENLIDFFGEVFPVFIAYLPHYERSDYEIIEVDGKPAVELEFKLELTDSINYRGKFDSIRRRGNKLFIFDWKVTSMSLTNWFFQKFELGPQNFSYSFTGKECFTDLNGFFIDAIQIKNEKHDFKMQYFPLVNMLDEFIAEVIRIGEWINAHIDNEDYFEHRYTACINRYNRKCEFADVCLCAPARRKNVLYSDLYEDVKPIYDFNT